MHTRKVLQAMLQNIVQSCVDEALSQSLSIKSLGSASYDISHIGDALQTSSDSSLLAGLMLTLGAEGALGFVVSHELVHGHHKMDQWLANIMLCTTGYMHWNVSHIAHHTQVLQHIQSCCLSLLCHVYCLLSPRHVFLSALITVGDCFQHATSFCLVSS